MPEHMCDTSTFGVADVRTLKILLTSPEQPVCVAALDALTKYAEGATKHRVQLLGLGIIDPLLTLVRSSDTAIKKSAIACVAATTELTSDFHPELRRKDLMTTLISLLSHDQPPEVQDEAAFGLANLAKDFANKTAIRNAGGIKALVHLLDSADPDVKKMSGHALAVMLEDFASRTEIRYVHGLAPLLELLASEYQEVQEHALNSLIRAAEDPGNRVEIREINGVRRIIDFLTQDVPELHYLALMCLANCLEDVTTSKSIFEMGGLSALVKLLGAEDVRTKRNAALTLSKAARIERNQILIRDAGALPALLSNLAHSDVLTASNAALALAELGKSETNQLELGKLGAPEALIKNVSHDDVEVPRQCAAALASLCLNAKIRTRIRNLDGVGGAVRLLGSEDVQTLVNTCEWIANFTDDEIIRAEMVKANIVHSLMMVLSRSDPKLQSAAAMALGRLLQDSEGRFALTREPPGSGLQRIIELIASKDHAVCKSAAYALSTAALNDSIAQAACRSGAIQNLLEFSRDPARHAPKFAKDALEKLLNYHVSAKFWLCDELTAANLITDGFYDIGSAGTHPTLPRSFPLLQELKDAPLDKRREILLLDSTTDPYLAGLVSLVSSEGPLHARTPRQQIRQIASVVAQVLGGPAHDVSNLQAQSYKFKITELKLKLGSNVVPLGSVAQGTFYHRALLFKYVCDKVGLAPVTLVRGDYGRAWNVVDVSRQTLAPPRVATPAASAAPSTPSKLEKPAKSARTRENADKTSKDKDKDREKDKEKDGAGGGGSGGANAAGGMAGSGTPSTATAQGPQVTQPTTLVPIVIPEPVADEAPLSEEKTIVDLMFVPGRLMLIGSPEADQYQRLT